MSEVLLTRGMNRPEVVRLKQMLNNVFGAGLETTSEFDEATENSVINFQRHYWPTERVRWTGVVTESTWQALEKAQEDNA